MSPDPHNCPDPLETVIDRTLRSLPEHRAPASLETRVLAAIAGRESLPWWRRSWSYWPRPAQAAFLVVSAALVAFVLSRGVALVSGSGQEPAERVTGLLAQLSQFAVACREAQRTVLGLVPLSWWLAGLALVATGYCALTGLGVVAYRMLCPRR